MRKNGITSTLFVFIAMFSFKIEAAFYSKSSSAEYTYDSLLAEFSLVILTSRNCPACKRLYAEVQKCDLPDNFRIAWVGSQISRYKFQKTNFETIKTSEKSIQKLTQVTPTSILKGRIFKEGVFDCKELEKAI